MSTDNLKLIASYLISLLTHLVFQTKNNKTGGSGASRTLTSRRTARFERGGLATCPALPNKMAESIRFERMTPVGCSALAVRRHRPLGQLSVNSGADEGI